MKKIILYVATSLDGFIARKNGSVDWLDKYNKTEEDYGYNEFLNSVSAVILGNTTYREFGAPYPNKKCFVFSRKCQNQDNGITYVSTSPKEFVKKLDINQGIMWLVGGAKIVESFFENKLVDELIITVIPIILGGGIPLFLSNCVNGDLALLNTKSYKSGIVQLHYKIRFN